MNEILKKRIEEAADTEMSQYYNDDEYPCGIKDIQSDFKEAFKKGAEYALSHQWISVEESLPEYEEDVLIAYGDDEYGLCHRSNNPDILTDINGFCNYAYKEVLAWLPIPKAETKKERI